MHIIAIDRIRMGEEMFPDHKQKNNTTLCCGISASSNVSKGVMCRNKKFLPRRFERRLVDSKSTVLTTTLWEIPADGAQTSIHNVYIICKKIKDTHNTSNSTLN